jgi:hypothetical protein
MWYKLFLSAVILFTSHWVSAQGNRPFLKVGVGAAVPLGKFGQTEINNSKAGFAKTGSLLNLSYSHPLGRRMWLEAMVQFQQNPLNTEALESGFSNTKFYQGVYVSNTLQPPSSFPSSIYENWSFKEDNWVTASLLAGVHGKYALGASNKVFAQAGLMLGPVYVSSPEIDGTSSSSAGMAQIKQTDADGWGLAYAAGGGITYDLNSRLYFLTQVDVFGTTSIKFKDINATLTSMNGSPSLPGTSIQQSSVTGDARQTISTLNLSVGLGLKL